MTAGRERVMRASEIIAGILSLVLLAVTALFSFGAVLGWLGVLADAGRDENSGFGIEFLKISLTFGVSTAPALALWFFLGMRRRRVIARQRDEGAGGDRPPPP
jgi:hypothetical protein